MKFVDEHDRIVEPLRRVELTDLSTDGTVVVSDSDGYYATCKRVSKSGEWSFIAAGMAGTQSIEHVAPSGQKWRLFMNLKPVTKLVDSNDLARRLYEHCVYTCVNFAELTHTRLDQRIFHFYVCWLRDHVHTLKGMKYVSADRLKDGIDLYALTQRDDGMIYDNCYPRDGTNYWDWRLAEGDFVKPFTDGFGKVVGEMKRIPVEADVEYLFVEGLYYTWKATGDHAWMREHLPRAQKAIDYCLSDPLRFSTKFGLVKRGYTIDTWDYQNRYDRVVEGDIMRVRLGETPFGIMHGDNTGVAAALDMLAVMYERVDERELASKAKKRAADIRARLDKLSWNGRFFTHHVREEPRPQADFGVDESSQISLSNAYSINRGITLEQQQAICDTYRKLRDDRPVGSPAEWFMIYPPFEKGFEGDNTKWHYMNGGVSPILAGELARGAFNCGREAYGADIVKRLLALVEANGNHVHATFTGNTAPRTLPAFRTLALRTFANVDTAGTGDASVPRWTGEGVNDFHQFKGGAIHVDRVPVELIDPETNTRRACVGLSTGRAGFARSVTVPVGHACGTVYFTHTCAKSPASNVVGCFEAKYDDGTVHREYVIRGQHVRGWWYPTENTDQRQTHLRVAWTGNSSKCTEVGLCTWAWRNPHPTKVLKELLLEPAAESSSPIAAWIVFGITTADRWYPFDDSPVSYGIPDNWAAAAVMYALIEGLAGIVDLGTKLDDVDISPKWSFTGDESAEVCVCYPQSGGYVAYHWRRQDDTVHLTLCGSGNGATLRVPLLESETVFMDGNEYPDPVIQTIGDTQYIEVCVPLRGVVEVIIG